MEMGRLGEARSYLVSRFGHDVRDVTAIGHGEWSRAYAFRHGEGDFVIRFSTFDEDFQKDRLAARFSSAAMPIPALVEIGEVDGAFNAISERACGGYLDDLDGEHMRAVLPSLFAMLDAARQVDLSATRGYGSWGADGNAPHRTWRDALVDVGNDRPGERTHGWRERLAASPMGAAPFDEAFEDLRRLTPFLSEERHLIHGDLLNFNVLVADGRLSAVIDWGCAMYGDGLYDLAWFLFWQPWYPAWRDIDFQQEAERHYAAHGLELPHFAARLRAYQIHIGLASLAYNAYKERWDMLAAVAARLRALASDDNAAAGQFHP